jgi:Tfp pilus assembly protein PilF
MSIARRWEKERDVSGGAHPWAEVATGNAYMQMGKPDEAQKVLDKLLERSKTEYVSPHTLACFHFVLGKNDDGFKWLNLPHFVAYRTVGTSFPERSV